MAASTTRTPQLSLHKLIVTFSYWGTTVRMMLVGFILLIAVALNALDVSSAVTLSQHAAQFVYILGSLLLLDAGYVTIARSMPLAMGSTDRISFLLLISVFSFAIVLPYFIAVPQGVLMSVKWVFLVSLFVLALRLVLGFFLGHSAKRK